MANHFTNLDAMWLSALADSIRDDNIAMDLDAIESRLRVIAANLQSLDERNQVLSNNRTYEQGWADAHAQMRSRSNVLPQEVDDGQSRVFDQIDRMVAEGKVKKVPLGERALEDRPDKFNAPIRKAKPLPRKDSLDIQLDLSGLDF